ncbi:MAG: hypothetical protein P8R54_30340 [Myxococcota bacterium]|nr:hypothetical protein [Myxococcota bacterium]
MEIELRPAPVPAIEAGLYPRRLAIAASLAGLPKQYTDLISNWLSLYPGRESAAAAVNTWLSMVRADLTTQGIQRGIATWITPFSSHTHDPPPVWPLENETVEYEPLCTRRFINRARQGRPMFKQKGRSLCGADARFIGLISAAVLCGVGLTEADDPRVPSTDLDAFVLVFDHIHQYMCCIAEQQTSTIQAIERLRRAGHRNWLGRAPTQDSRCRSQHQHTNAAHIFDWALEQTWPMDTLRDAPLQNVLRRQKLWQVRRPLLAHLQRHRNLEASAIPLTLSSALITAAERAPDRAVEVLARDLLTLGLWCLKAECDPDTEALLNKTLYALSARLISSPPSSQYLTIPQLVTLLESLPVD